MPSSLHDTLVSLFRDRPKLAVDLVSGVLGRALPEFDEIRPATEGLEQSTSPQHRADAVFSLWRAGERALALIVEVQLDRNQDKRWSWPTYVAGVRAKLRCPTALLVVTPYRGVAKWASEEISLGLTGDRVTPIVLGPEAIPSVVDIDVAKGNPELALLSLVAHATDEEARGVGGAALAAAGSLKDEEKGKLFYDIVKAVLAKAILEELMEDQKYLSEFARKYVAEGEARGKAEGLAEGEAKGTAEGLRRALLSMLTVRRILLSVSQRERLLACQNAAELERWIARAATAEGAAEIFES